MNDLFAFIVTFIATFFSAFGSFCMKKSADTAKSFKEQLFSFFLFMGVGLYGISVIMFIFALKYSELSFLYPITSLAYIWVAVISSKYLNEKMNNTKWSGIGLIILGVILVTFKN